MWGLLTGRSVLPKKLKRNHFGCLRPYSSRQIFNCWSNRAWREDKPGPAEVAAHRASVSNGVFNCSFVAGRIALSAVERTFWLLEFSMPKTKREAQREHHYFRAIVTYVDGETSANRVFKDRSKAERYAERQKRSRVVKKVALEPFVRDAYAASKVRRGSRQR